MGLASDTTIALPPLNSTPAAIIQLVSHSLETTAIHRMVLPMLHSKHLTMDYLVQLDEILNDHSRSRPDPMPICIRIECLMTLHGLRQIERREPIAWQFWNAMNKIQPTVEQANESQKLLHLSLAANAAWLQAERSERYFERERELAMQLFMCTLNRLEQPTEVVVAEWENDAYRLMQRKRMVTALIPELGVMARACALAETRLAMARTAIEVYRWQLIHSDFPRAAEEVWAPDERQSIPSDGYTGHPLSIVVNDDQLEIVTVPLPESLVLPTRDLQYRDGRLSLRIQGNQ